MPIFTAIFGLLGSIFSAGSNIAGNIIGFKTEQARTVQKALDVVKSIDDNDATATTATANALQEILTQGSFLEKNWRSWLMILIMVELGCNFFGYYPPHFNDVLSPMQERLFTLLEIGLGGYIIRRGIVDIVRMFSISSILKELIRKKVL